MKQNGRARLSDGSKLEEIPRDALRIRTINTPIPKITGSALEREVIERVEQDQARYVAEYLANPKNHSGGAPVIATDAAKELFPEFRADAAGADRDVAAAAARVNKAALETVLAMPVDPAKPEVQIMTASPGSGKTANNILGATADPTGLKIEHITDDFSASRTLLQKLLDAGRQPVVRWVYVDDVGKTVERMFRRAIGHGGNPGIGRTVQLNYMAHAFKSIPDVLAKLQDHFGDRVQFRVTDNSGPKDAPRPPATDNLIPYLDAVRGQRYDEVGKRIAEVTEELRDEGLFESEPGKRALAAAQTTDRPDAQNPRAVESGSDHGGNGQGGGGPDAQLSGASGPRSSVLDTQPKRAVDHATAPVSESGGGGVSAEEFARQVQEARQRTVRDNALLAAPKLLDTDHGPAVVFDAESYALWHRTHVGQRKMPDGSYEKPVAWRGMTLPRRAANEVVVQLRAAAGTARARGAGADVGAGIDRLVDMMGKARRPDGSLTLLRGDYRADTLREEAWHGWQVEHGLGDSDAMREVAQRPEFRATAEALRETGYGLRRGIEGQNELAQEMMAKALAGDPDLKLTNDERFELVQSFLTEALKEKGSGIFTNLPKADPRAEGAIAEARRHYEAESDEGRGRPAVRGSDRERGEGSAGRGPNPRDSGEEPAGRGLQPRDEGAEEDQNQLRFQRGRLAGEQPLPGMGDAVRLQDEAAAEQRGEDLTTEMRRPGADISRRAGEMERTAPLFAGTEASGQGSLFQRGSTAENPVARSVRDLVDELGAMPRPDRGTRLEQATDWLGSKAAESLNRTGAAWSEKPAMMERALAKTKTVFAALVDDYRNPVKETDWKKTVGQMQLARAETALQMKAFARELQKAAPDKLTRIGMTHWIEAGGDPKKLLEAVKAFSGRVTWYSNDIAFLQSAYEKMASGMDLKTALRETGKHIPDYRMPTRIFDSPQLAKTLSNKNLVMFMHYHYGALRSYGEMLKSLGGVGWDQTGENAKGEPVSEAGRTRDQEKQHGLDILAMLGLITLVVYPEIDKLLRKLTGDENATIRRAGASTLPNNLLLMAHGEKSPTDVIESVVTPSALLKLGVETGINRDLYTGKKVYSYPEGDWETRLMQVGHEATGSFGPANQYLRSTREGVGKSAMGILGVSFQPHGAMKIASEIASEKAGQQALTPQERRQLTARYAALDALRSGDHAKAHDLMREAGLDPRQRQNLLREAKEDPLLAKVNNFTVDELQQVYDHATPEEKIKLGHLLRQKEQRQRAKTSGAR